MSFGDKFRIADINKNLVNPATKESVEAVTQKLGSVEDSVDAAKEAADLNAQETQQAISELDLSVNATTTAVEETTAAVNNVGQSVDDVKTAVDQNKAAVNLVKTAVDAVTAAVNFVKTAVDAVAARVTTNTEAVEAVQEDCEGVTANRSAQCGDYVVAVSQPGANTTAFFTNEDVGINMAIAPETEPPVVEQWVYGGGPSGEPPAGQVPWTAEQLSGNGWNFNETQLLFDTAAYQGVFYVDATGGNANSEAVFTPAAGATYDTSAATDLVIFVYVTSWNQDNSNRDWTVRFRDGAGNTIGNELSMKPYVPDGSENQWIPVTVPIADFGLTTPIVSDMVFKITSGRVNLNFDSIQFQSTTANGVTFKIEPPPGFVYIVEAINWTIIDDHDTIPGGGPALDDHKIGNFQLSQGLLFEFQSDAFPNVQFVTKSIADVRRVGANINFTAGNPPTGQGLPGQVRVMTQLKSDQARPFKLRSSQNEALCYTIREDLSEIKTLQICAICGIIAESDIPERY